MRNALPLSRLFLLGSLRRQAHVATVVLGVVLLCLPSYVSAFSLGINAFERVSKDFGLTMIGLFGAGMAVMLGSTSLPRDLESRAIYPLLARPVSRGGYLMGHFLALAGLLALSHLFLAGCLMLALAIKKGEPDPSVMLAVYGCYLQAIVIGAVCLTFSAVCSPALTGTIGAATWILGNLSGAFVRFFLIEDRDSGHSALLARSLKGLTPNLTLFDIKDPAVHQLPLPAGYLASISYYAAVWVVVLLLLARVALLRRDL